MIKIQADLKYCDICNNEITKKNGAYDGRIKIKMDGLDYNNIAVGDASLIFRDVCDDCIYSVKKHIEKIKNVMNM